MKIANTPAEVPESHHYAIILYSTNNVYIPGDERSRTNPGHGYPERTESYTTTQYTYTHNREEYVTEINNLEHHKLHHRPQSYLAIEVAGKAKISINVVVD